MKNEVLELTKEWESLRKEKEEKIGELKQKTKEAMKVLDSQLKSHGMWDHTWTCRIAFNDDGDRTGYGDQEAVLYWDRDKGYCVEYFVCQYSGQWDPITRGFDMKVEKVDLETLNSHHLMAIAKELPDRVKQLSELYMEEVSSIKNTIENIK